MRFYIRKVGDRIPWCTREGEDRAKEAELVIEYGVIGFDNDNEITIPIKELADALKPYIQEKDAP